MVAAWDFGTATITTVGYVFIGLGALSLDPGVVLFGELLTYAGSALATVPMSLTLLRYGMDCEASGTAASTWTWGALMTGFAPGDLLMAWYQFYYDVTELFK